MLFISTDIATNTDHLQRRCQAFIDPLIEAPPLLIVLDLVLLKPRVFLHLLFNRGSPPATSGGTEVVKDKDGDSVLQRNEVHDRKARVNADLVSLTAATIAAEVAVRVVPALHSLDFAQSITLALLTTVRVGMELAAQLGASTLLALVILRLKGWYPFTGKQSTKEDDGTEAMRDGRQESFLPALIPLTLVYTALLPLLLQLALGIWYPPHPSIHESPQATGTFLSPLALIPEFILARLPDSVATTLADITTGASDVWADADRVWAGTRLLGGMSAGFGLRVLLPTRPYQTTTIVLAGWGAAVGAGRLFDIVYEHVQG